MNQGSHLNCTVYAMAASIAAQIASRYGERYNPGAQYIAHVIMTTCGAWSQSTLVGICEKIQECICERHDVWLGTSEFRIRFGLEWKMLTTFDEMKSHVREGMWMPCVARLSLEDDTAHALAITGLAADGRFAIGRNSWGGRKPLMCIVEGEDYTDVSCKFMDCVYIVVTISHILNGLGNVLSVPSVLAGSGASQCVYTLQSEAVRLAALAAPEECVDVAERKTYKERAKAQRKITRDCKQAFGNRCRLFEARIKLIAKKCLARRPSLPRDTTTTIERFVYTIENAFPAVEHAHSAMNRARVATYVLHEERQLVKEAFHKWTRLLAVAAVETGHDSDCTLPDAAEDDPDYADTL